MNLSRLNLYNTERTTGKKFGILALIGLMLIPAVLAASFQWTQVDATQNLDRLDAAVVNLDEPVTLDGRLVPIGRVMVERLTDDTLPVNINWTLTDEQDAKDGIESGKYAAVVTIPESFSADATSVSLMDPDKVRPAVLDVQTSQAAGVMDPTIGQALTVTITSALNNELTNEFLKNLYLKIAPMKKQLKRAVDGSGKIAGGLDQAYDGSVTLLAGLKRIAWGAGRIADGNGQLADGMNLMYNKTKDLPPKIQMLTDGAHMVWDGTNEMNDAIAAYKGDLRNVLDLLREVRDKTGPQQRLAESVVNGLDGMDSQLATAVSACQATPNVSPCTEVLAVDHTLSQLRQDLAVDQSQDLLATLLKAISQLNYYSAQVNALTDGMNKLAWGAGRVSFGMDRLNAGIPQLVDGIKQARDGSVLLANGSRRLAAGTALAAGETPRLVDGLDQLRDGSYLLHNGLADGYSQIPDWSQEEALKMMSALAAPVQPQEPQLPNPDLSAGYFTALALAIAALVVFMLIRAVPVRAMSSSMNAFKLTMQAYWPAVVIAALQALLVVVALQFALHLSVAKLAAFTGVVFLAALCMLAVSQALVAALGGAGRFVALFAIAVSAPTALISTTPAALQTLIDLTPISPTIDALRGVITGANIGAQITALLVWGVLALVVTTVSITKERQVSVRALARIAA